MTMLTSARSTVEAISLVTKYLGGGNQLPKANNYGLNKLLDAITVDWSEDVSIQTSISGYLVKLGQLCKSIPERDYNDVVVSKFCLFYLATKLEDVGSLPFEYAHEAVMLHE